MRHDDIRASLAAATPGPWAVASGNRVIAPGQFQPGFEGVVLRIGETFMGMAHVDDAVARRNAEFLAHARADIEWLLTELEGND